MKSNGKRSANGRRAPRKPVDIPPPPPSTWATDSEEFREQVQEEARKVFGARLDEMVLDFDLRDMMYGVLARRLRETPKPISTEMLETVEQLRAAGLEVTPGHGDLSHRKPLHIPGFSLTEAVLEERYGTDYVPPKRRR